MKKIIFIIVSILVFAGNAFSQASSVENLNKKTFQPSDKVKEQRVSFYNRLGIHIVGDMYMPLEMNPDITYPAIIVGHPYGGVKEQSSGLYAQKMAEYGFVTIAIDLSYGGESGGQPRYIASPEAYVEDFSAAVDFMGTRPFIDRNRIGVIGICGSGSFVVSAASVDPRMKAIATVNMYDMGRSARNGLGDVTTDEQRRQALLQVGEQRWKEFEGEPTRYRMGTPMQVNENSPAVAREFFDYYRTPRGQHPRANTAISMNSTPARMNFYPFQNITWISPRPLLFIAGENAHSRYFSEDAFKLAGEPKELYIVPGAGHVDLYDRMNLIPFEKLNSFFAENL